MKLISVVTKHDSIRYFIGPNTRRDVIYTQHRNQLKTNFTADESKTNWLWCGVSLINVSLKQLDLVGWHDQTSVKFFTSFHNFCL